MFCPYCGEPREIDVDKSGQYGILLCPKCDRQFRFELNEPRITENN